MKYIGEWQSTQYAGICVCLVAI